MRWLTNIGDPQATSTYTVDQLKALGMVGVYAPDDPDPVTIVEAST